MEAKARKQEGGGVVDRSEVAQHLQMKKREICDNLRYLRCIMVILLNNLIKSSQIITMAMVTRVEKGGCVISVENKE